jgi:hypothetical protein
MLAGCGNDGPLPSGHPSPRTRAPTGHPDPIRKRVWVKGRDGKWRLASPPPPVLGAVLNGRRGGMSGRLLSSRATGVRLSPLAQPRDRCKQPRPRSCSQARPRRGGRAFPRGDGAGGPRQGWLACTGKTRPTVEVASKYWAGLANRGRFFWPHSPANAGGFRCPGRRRSAPPRKRPTHA